MEGKKNYSLEIFFHELPKNTLIEENKPLHGHKRKPDLDLATEQANRLNIDQKLEDVIKGSENRKKGRKKNAADE